MTNLFLLFIALLFLQFNVLAQEGWVLQNSGVTNKLVGVFFTDADNGTAVGFGGTILHTTNGGVTWDSLSINNVEIIWDVHFINTNIGMAVGAVDSGYIIMKTTDGGISWDSLYSGTTVGNGLYGIFLIDENTATAVGQGTILRTTDGGTSWVGQSNQPWVMYTDVYFTDVDNGTVVGGDSILHTTNGGTDWVSQPSGDLWSVWFTDANTGTAVGRGAKIIKTTDGGATWDSLTISTTNDLWDVCFTNANTGTVVTGWGYGGDHGGEIFRTTDGGLTWQCQLSNYPGGFHSVYFTDTNTGTVVGNNGTIFHTTNGGISYVNERKNNEVPNDFNLTQNNPNPFNPSTRIIYSIPTQSKVVLKVYDLLGNEIETLVNEEKPAGTYELTWYAENLPSGVYFYQLRANSFVETKKMVLMK